ncbi:MAG: CoA transferase [Rhodospirillales bacterium]|nr:CoA transferase [Rhodospirillales bacterium]
MSVHANAAQGASPSSTPARPLRGVRVLDLSWLLPGPFCTNILAELGAEVVKVERPEGGDHLRTLMPGASAIVNRGKRSIVLDLKRVEDRETFDALLAASDVFVESFRPGVAQRLGCDWATLSARHDRLIYLSLSGYGQDGPLAQHPGHDINYLALAGAMGIPGHWGEEPRRSGLPVGDLAAALYGVINILAALRARDAGGRGTFIDLAIAESVLHWSQIRIADLDRSGAVARWGHLQPGSDVFATADGARIALGVVEGKFWRAIAEAVGDPALARRAEDFEHARWETREAVGDALRTSLGAAISAHACAHWERVLAAADVPFSVIADPAGAMEAPQFIARGMVATIPERPGGVRVAALPGRRYRGVAGRAPALDEHGAALRAEVRERRRA